MAKRKSMKITSNDEHTLPGPVSPKVLNQFQIDEISHEGMSIVEYVEGQAPEEKVRFLEKVKTEYLFDDRYDVWNVNTDSLRYWVITNPTNLYSQDYFPSLDYTLSFHIGVTLRVMARNETILNEYPSRLTIPWRLWMQAGEALRKADEAEEFQAIGMRCRECLISLIKKIKSDSMVPGGQEKPKASDFIHWSELIANAIAQGNSSEEVRQYLKSISKSTWQLVNWLVHASNAVRADGHLALSATEHVLFTFGNALLKYEKGIPDRCPRCSSYRIKSVYSPELDIDPPYLNICESCGWTEKEV